MVNDLGLLKNLDSGLRGIIGVLGRIDFVERLRAVESELDVDSWFREMRIES